MDIDKKGITLKLLNSYPANIIDLNETYVTASVSINGNDIIIHLDRNLFSFDIYIGTNFIIELWEIIEKKTIKIRKWEPIILNEEQNVLLKNIVEKFKSS